MPGQGVIDLPFRQFNDFTTQRKQLSFWPDLKGPSELRVLDQRVGFQVLKRYLAHTALELEQDKRLKSRNFKRYFKEWLRSVLFMQNRTSSGTCGQFRIVRK